MNKILVIAHREDERPTAINKALKLAEHYCADIHIMTFCYEDFETTDGFSAEHLKQVKLKIIDERHQWTQAQIEEMNCAKVNVTFDVQWQKEIYKSVLDELSTNEYQFIVTQHHDTASFFHIPTEWYLIRESQIPIYVAREDKWVSNSTVLAAVDLKNDSAQGKLLQEQVLSTASDFAKTIGATLHCCFCFETPEVLIDLDVIDLDSYQNNVREKYSPQLQALAQKYNMSDEQVHIKFGKAEKCIASVATKSKAHAVVIGSMARKGIKGKIIGNTAEKLTQYLHTDMLIVPSI